MHVFWYTYIYSVFIFKITDFREKREVSILGGGLSVGSICFFKFKDINEPYSSIPFRNSKRFYHPCPRSILDIRLKIAKKLTKMCWVGLTVNKNDAIYVACKWNTSSNQTRVWGHRLRSGLHGPRYVIMLLIVSERRPAAAIRGFFRLWCRVGVMPVHFLVLGCRIGFTF